MIRTEATPVPISTVDPNDLRNQLEQNGFPAWRADQIMLALWQPETVRFDQIKQLPKSMQEWLNGQFLYDSARVVNTIESDAGMTFKMLCDLQDGQTIETVAMESPANFKHKRRTTICVSSQVGCAVGCPFCATAQMGLQRNCTTAEIVDQVRLSARLLQARNLGPITNIVYMGMGEPLANYVSAVQSLKILASVGKISPRRITVSTSGVLPGINRLAEEKLPITLAISLHAADNELRNELVPLNKKYPIENVVEAGINYAKISGRRLSFEWCLIGGVNDSLIQARKLRDLAYEANAHINVIPMNLVEGSPWGPPSDLQTKAFMSQLRGVRVTQRGVRGADSNAACGQLRAALRPRRTVQPNGQLSPMVKAATV